MSKGKSLATLLATLDYDAEKLLACVEALKKHRDVALSPEILRGFVVEGREYLAFESLIDLGAIQTAENSQSTDHYMLSGDLNWLTGDGQLIIDALESNRESEVSPQPQPELAWTLPVSFANATKLESSPRSLAGLLRYAISRAQRDLIIVSPFLEKQGLEHLEPPLRGAAGRGVDILLIAHDLAEPNSYGRRAFESLKKTVPTIKGYSSPVRNRGDPYVLIHSKVIIADEVYVVLSSANLTQHGLTSHLEIGVGISGKVATDLAMLFREVIKTDLVELIV